MANFFSQLRLTAAFRITRNVVVHGSVNAPGNAYVNSVVEGDVTTKGKLVVGKNGNIKGNVQASDVSVYGTIDGNLNCLNKAFVGNKAYITGNINSSIIEIQEGAVVKGAVIKKTERSIVEERMNDHMKKEQEQLHDQNTLEITAEASPIVPSAEEDKTPSNWF